MTEEAPLPEGAGRMPRWWLAITPHDSMEEEEYEAKVKREAEERDEAAIAEAEAALQALSRKNSNDGEDDEERVDSSELAKAFLAASKEVETKEEAGDERRKGGAEISPTADRDASDEIASRRANLKHVETKVAKYSKLSDTVMVGAVRETPLGDAQEEQVSPEDSSKKTSPLSVDSTGPSLSSGKKGRKPFKTAFTGVSSFDFAMQQRAREKERRAREREARESLAHHHAQQASSDKASALKALSLEQKKQKKEAEEALKSFNGASLGSEFTQATELKKLHDEQKRKKKEAATMQHLYKSAK